ncbi:MAG: hypothetical protein A3G40_08295 [Deltaproteobacteria bacterium RIFCSPLOWO2_12_FULL_57_22]|nr:MAG: hypothetical protein A3G40_08295 [Deltaproteobacteria bacterium RIFCSPLOWO2_12_FULL_57_22]
MKRYLILIFFLLSPQVALSAQTGDLELQARSIAAELRCVVCQNLSVADSPSEVAQQMRGIIREQLQAGKTREEIKAYFVSKYGEWVLLSPSPKGFSLLVWVLPFVAVIAGILFVVFVVRRWAQKNNRAQPPKVDPALIERVQRDVATAGASDFELEEGDVPSPLLQERTRLYANLKELEFDYQARKLSEADYRDLRSSLETQAAVVLRELELSARSPSGAQAVAAKKRPAPEKEAAKVNRASRPGWQLAAGGVFLLLFGITLGVLLTRSLRPRASEQDSVTGDFLTGTGPGGVGDRSRTMETGMGAASAKDIPALLAQGRAAYERQEWAKAIEAFKKTLSVDSNHPEAHTYMGLILAQAGHADGALLAFDRALAANPEFPLALWGKGMLLYRGKEDFTGAQQTLQKLVNLMPPGAERTEVEKALAELAALKGKGKQPVKKAEASPTASQPQQINGVVSIDPKLKEKINNRAVLFIIVRSGNTSAGPPLAVKKIDQPSFPLNYSISPQDVMTPGVSLSGEVFISARLDQDGNAVTREPGNLEGEYRKNPVKVGAQKVDIVLNRVM